VVWLTTEPWPDREKTGLGMSLTKCDRMTYRYRITDDTLCRPWLLSDERGSVAPDILHDLEDLGDPEHWWITPGPTPARLA
jgi:hypothetical protein